MKTLISFELFRRITLNSNFISRRPIPTIARATSGIHADPPFFSRSGMAVSQLTPFDTLPPLLRTNIKDDAFNLNSKLHVAWCRPLARRPLVPGYHELRQKCIKSVGGVLRLQSVGAVFHQDKDTHCLRLSSVSLPYTPRLLAFLVTQIYDFMYVYGWIITIFSYGVFIMHEWIIRKNILENNFQSLKYIFIGFIFKIIFKFRNRVIQAGIASRIDVIFRPRRRTFADRQGEA